MTVYIWGIVLDVKPGKVTLLWEFGIASPYYVGLAMTVYYIKFTVIARSEATKQSPGGILYNSRRNHFFPFLILSNFTRIN